MSPLRKTPEEPLDSVEEEIEFDNITVFKRLITTTAIDRNTLTEF